MEMTNMSQCDPCLMDFLPLYPLYLVLPALVDIPLKCYVFWTQSSSPLSDKTDLLTLNILFVDFLMSVSAAVTALSLLWGSALYTYVWSLLVALMGFAHPLSNAVVCVERYFAVQQPVVFLKYRPLRYRFAVLAVTWLSTTVIGTTVMAVCGTSPSRLDAFLYFECLLLAAIMSVNSVASLSVLRALVHPPPGDRNAQNGAAKKDNNNVKRAAFIVILLVQINMFIIYMPTICVFIYGVHKIRKRFCSVYLFNVWYILILSDLHALRKLHSSGKFCSKSK